AMMSRFQPDALWPFHEGLVVVMKFSNFALNPREVIFELRKLLGIPVERSHPIKKHSCDKISALPTAFDTSIGSLKYPPDKKRPRWRCLMCCWTKSFRGMQSPSEKIK